MYIPKSDGDAQSIPSSSVCVSYGCDTLFLWLILTYLIKYILSVITRQWSNIYTARIPLMQRILVMLFCLLFLRFISYDVAMIVMLEKFL
jgi:hypothetical protein